MANIISPVNSLQLLVQEEVASLQLTQYPMVNRLAKKVTSQQVIKWNANVGGAGATGELTTASVSTFSDDDYVAAILPIGGARLRNSFQLQKEDIAQAKAAGKGVLRDLFAADINSGVRTILEALSTKVYTGTGIAADGGVIGLVSAAAATGAYAGLDPASYSAWASYVNTAGANRALTADLMYATEVGIARKGGNYTSIYCSPEIAVKYKNLFAAQLSITNQLPAGQADISYTGLTFSGRPIIQDVYAPAGTLYFVDENEVALYSFAQNNSQDRQGLQFSIGELPSDNPDAEKYVIYTKAQLQLKNRAKGVAVLDKITQ
ncbi:phage major capsid protein [Nostoc sp. ChiQUE01b]|uniref:phage major capsid protein n=1 Tax=Nostoc sp. ChiQUE01b TaxID=3075376 RepID=UPI002AD4B1BB|nr:phage major capsid protein [Nostoc sp. ChiQUE01b]MDZ8259458.1 phage major capsid protein [Nostoc sp. ChiQUE01b]